MSLHVVESGPEGAPVVALVHGAMDRATGFAKVARRLEHLRVVRYDRRGYGRSKPHPGPFVMDAHVEDLLAVLDGRAAVVVGHSYGGNVALATAQRHPELVRAVGVYEVPLAWLDWWPNTTAGRRGEPRPGPADPADAAEAFLRRIVGDDRWARVPPRTREDRRREGAALVSELTDLRDRVPWSPERITVPVVVGHGGPSTSYRTQSTAWVGSCIAGAERFAIPAAGHGAHLSHPDEFAAFVARAIARAGEG